MGAMAGMLAGAGAGLLAPIVGGAVQKNQIDLQRQADREITSLNEQSTRVAGASRLLDISNARYDYIRQASFKVADGIATLASMGISGNSVSALLVNEQSQIERQMRTFDQKEELVSFSFEQQIKSQELNLKYQLQGLDLKEIMTGIETASAISAQAMHAISSAF